MNSTLTGTVAMYLAQVRAELSDLPPGELEDVLDDVSGHLTEVAGEFDSEPSVAALQDRLGTPRQYADELRTAAGYPPRAQRVADREAGRKSLLWGMIAATVGPFFVAVGIFAWGYGTTAFLGALGLGILFVAGFLGVRALKGNDPRIVLDTPYGERGAAAIRDLISQIPPNIRRELVAIGQPVWWVARGAIGGGGFFAIFGAGAVTVVGAVAGAAVSIWIGRKTQQNQRWLWYVVPLNVVAVVAIPAFLAAAYLGASFNFLAGNDRDYSGPSYGAENGLFLNGTAINNIYPFDAQGKQVEVRLYDENGNPIDLPTQDCAASFGADEPTTSNVFPQAVTKPDENGDITAQNCQETDKAPFVPPLAAPTAKPSGNSPTTPAPGSPGPKTPTPGVTLTVEPTR